MSGRYEVAERYDPDLQAALESGGERALEKALAEVCRCGHERRDHMAATGALGSFGGSACDRCWTCRTFHALTVSAPSGAADETETTA